MRDKAIYFESSSNQTIISSNAFRDNPTLFFYDCQIKLKYKMRTQKYSNTIEFHDNLIAFSNTSMSISNIRTLFTKDNDSIEILIVWSLIYFDEKQSIQMKKEPNDDQVYKLKKETSSSFALLLLPLLFLLKLRLSLNKKSMHSLILIGFLKILASHTPIDNFRQLKLMSDAEFFTVEIIQVINKINLTEFDFNTIIVSIHMQKVTYQVPLLKLLLLLSWDIELNPGPPQVCNIWTPFTKKGLHFIHLNINSVLPKIEELRQVAKKTKAAIIGITETKLDSSIFDSEIFLEGYTLLRKDRNRHGGGVACYIRNDVCFDIINIFPLEIENIFIKILLPKTKPFVVGIFYRPPNQNDFLDSVSSDFHKLFPEKNDLFILGDMNINSEINGKSIFGKTTSKDFSAPIPALGKQYKEFCSSFSLTQLIDSPTRITSTSSSVIDHVLTNSREKISNSGVIELALSDHHLIFCTRKLKRQKFNCHKNIKCRSLENYTVEKFIEELNSSNFQNYETFDNIDNAYSDFISRFMAAIDKVAPLREIRVKNRTQDWFDRDIFQAIKSRNEKLKKFKKSRLIIDQENLKKSKYLVHKMIKSKKRLFIENKLKENIGKPKELWKILKSLGLPKKCTEIPNICLKSEKKLSFDSKDIAEIFKNYFSELAENLLLKLPPAPKIFGSYATSLYYRPLNLMSNEFQFSKVNVTTVTTILENIDPSKAAGFDNIGGKFVKDGLQGIATPITELCNLSIKHCIFPTDCKIAKLKPIFKKGSKTDPKNYRPISLLPLISKIIEKVIHDQMQIYLSENNILYEYQSGFRTNHSTDFALSFLNDKILKGFDKGYFTGMILIDLQKAFDTIDHKLLLEKMYYIGFSNEVILWFRSYLSNRKFIVNIKDKYSSPGAVTCGVPQGSILGPLLFLLYVNDMKQAIKSELLLYADDSCILMQHKDVKVIEEQLNRDFSSVCDWFVDNKLSIHFGEDKTKSILFASKHKIKKADRLNISYNDINIKQHSSVSYLGCILNETLSGESMALEVIKKANARLRFLFRNNRFLTPYLRRLLCNSLIQPHLDYASAAWFPNLTSKMKKKIQIVQNKCIRFCLQLSNRTHIGFEQFEKINWLSCEDRFRQTLCSAVFKFVNENSPKFMSEVFNISHQSNLGTRCSFLKLDQPFRKTNAGQSGLSYKGPGEWNKLPNEFKEGQNLNTFKHRLKRFYFDQMKNKEYL